MLPAVSHVTTISDRSRKNQPSERKLHRVISSAIYSPPNVVSHFH